MEGGQTCVLMQGRLAEANLDPVIERKAKSWRSCLSSSRMKQSIHMMTRAPSGSIAEVGLIWALNLMLDTLLAWWLLRPPLARTLSTYLPENPSPSHTPQAQRHPRTLDMVNGSLFFQLLDAPRLGWSWAPGSWPGPLVQGGAEMGHWGPGRHCGGPREQYS